MLLELRDEPGKNERFGWKGEKRRKEAYLLHGFLERFFQGHLKVLDIVLDELVEVFLGDQHGDDGFLGGLESVISSKMGIYTGTE